MRVGIGSTHIGTDVALTVLAPVVARPAGGKAVVDAGTKAIDNQK